MAAIEHRASTPESLFGGAREWVVFAPTEAADNARVPALSFPVVAKTVRNALMACWSAVDDAAVPEALSGHTADGAATPRPHVAVVPLLEVGRAGSTGELAGLAVVLPRAPAGEARRDVLRAVAAFAETDPGGARLTLGRLGVWRLRREAVPSSTALKLGPYLRPSTAWASVTPVLLDRFTGRDASGQTAAMLAQACRNIGLPAPSAVDVMERSVVEGALPANPDRTSPGAWIFPQASRLAARPRRHVVLSFSEPVAGPVILGAGRFQGMGLCRVPSEPR